MDEAGHLSDFLLDRLRAGDLDGPREQEVRAHLAACEDCRARAAALDGQAAEFLAGTEAPADFARRIAARRSERVRTSSMRPLGIGLAAAAAAALIVAYGLMPSEKGGDRIRTKGSVDLSFYVDQDGSGRPGLAGETLREGDRIRLAVEPGAHRFAFVVSVTASGEVTPLYPEGNGQSVPVTAGERSLLEGSVILDAYLGEERLFALFSDRPLGAEQVVAAARQALNGVREQDEPGVQSLHRLPLEVSQATIWFRKE